MRADEISSAALLTIPFVLLYGVYALALPLTPAQVDASDAIVRVALDCGGVWTIAFVTLLTVVAWAVSAPPSFATVVSSIRRAVQTIAVVGAGMILLRLFIGPQLPGFIPPEESAEPGLVLGLGAGLIEEALFRLGVLPAALAVANRWLVPRAWLAAVVAALVTGVTFAVAHEIGANSGPFTLVYLVDRVFLPGMLFSLAAIRFGWTVPVVGHCFAHVMMPLLFH